MAIALNYRHNFTIVFVTVVLVKNIKMTAVCPPPPPTYPQLARIFRSQSRESACAGAGARHTSNAATATAVAAARRTPLASTILVVVVRRKGVFRHLETCNRSVTKCIACLVLAPLRER